MDRLTQALAAYKDKEILTLAFNFIKSVIDEYKYNADSESLVMNLTQQGKMNVQVGNKRILTLEPPGNFSILWPEDVDPHPYGCFDVSNFFIPRRHYKNATWVIVKFWNDQEIHPYLKRIWMEQVHIEARKTKKSPFRKYHNSSFFKIVADIEERKKVFDQIF